MYPLVKQIQYSLLILAVTMLFAFLLEVTLKDLLKIWVMELSKILLLMLLLPKRMIILVLFVTIRTIFNLKDLVLAMNGVLSGVLLMLLKIPKYWQNHLLLLQTMNCNSILIPLTVLLLAGLNVWELKPMVIFLWTII